MPRKGSSPITERISHHPTDGGRYKIGKQLEHYANGKDRTDGMHPGIRSKCPMCNSMEPIPME